VDAKPIETDYLVIGGGATAMAFVDTLLSESDAQAVPVFDSDAINLLMVRFCQPLFSAALIAYVESHESVLTEKEFPMYARAKPGASRRLATHVGRDPCQYRTLAG
jgi:hypothetical protein